MTGAPPRSPPPLRPTVARAPRRPPASPHWTRRRNSPCWPSSAASKAARPPPKRQPSVPDNWRPSELHRVGASCFIAACPNILAASHSTPAYQRVSPITHQNNQVLAGFSFGRAPWVRGPRSLQSSSIKPIVKSLGTPKPATEIDIRSLLVPRED